MKSFPDVSPSESKFLESDNQAKTAPSFWRMARNNVRLLYQSPPIQKAPRDGALPLSFNQERLWQLEQLQPDTSVHNILHSFQLVGALNVTALEQSLHEITRRHEILRTFFRTENGEPVQVILPEMLIRVDYIDLRDLPTEQQQAEIERRAIAQAEVPFDLSQAPLWRVALLQLAEQEHVLLRTIHHIVFDGMSHSVFVRELGALYSAFVGGQASPLLDLPVQYADFAWTQRQWLQGDSLRLQLEYWQQQLHGTVPSLALPIDYPRSPVTSYQGGVQSQVLSTDLTNHLKLLSANQGVSLFVTLFAAFNILLHQHTGQEDMVICTPVAGRHRAEARGLIGYFNNVVVLRTDLSANPSFCQLLERVSESFMEGSKHQDVPLQLVADLPNLRRTPLTRAMFVLQNTPTPSLDLAGLTVSSVFVNREIANFDISLSLSENNGQLTATFQYKTDLFRPETVIHLLQRYEQLLAQLVLNPDLKLSELRSFKPSECKPSELTKSTAKYIEGDRVDSLPDKISVAPRTLLEQQLAQVWEEVLAIPSVGVNDNFFELGGHSLLAVSLFSKLEKQFGRSLPLSTLLMAPTIAQLAEYLERSGPSQVQQAIVPLKPGSGQPPIFLIHDGNGEILLYQELANRLSADVPVYGVQPYSADGCPILHTRIEEMVAYYIEKIREVQPEGPYFLGGLCAGGVLAFEMARQLQLQGQSIGMVAIMDAADVEAEEKVGYIANQRRDSFSKVFRDSQSMKPFERGVFILNQVRKKVTNLVSYEIQKRYKTLHDRGQLQLFRYCLDRKLPIPHWLKAIPVRTILVWAQAQYVPDTVLQGEVLLLRATEKSSMFDGTPIDDTPYVERYADPLLGWKHRVTADVKVCDVPGGHSSMLQEPNVQVMAKMIQSYWNGVQKSGIVLNSNIQRAA
ncbi:condensation domain-containing protein [Leptodesmis sp.]|uniref:condensation domain-containing protein n=1 Tax=Leptodesmis sp. TaxID=3100501 RepID=UPI0040534B1B